MSLKAQNPKRLAKSKAVSSGSPAAKKKTWRNDPRGKEGCLTCRVRHKRCSSDKEETENKRPCKTCRELRVECLEPDKQRPPWLKNNLLAVKKHIRQWALEGGRKADPTGTLRFDKFRQPPIVHVGQPPQIQDAASPHSSNSDGSPESQYSELTSETSGTLSSASGSQAPLSPSVLSESLQHEHEHDHHELERLGVALSASQGDSFAFGSLYHHAHYQEESQGGSPTSSSGRYASEESEMRESSSALIGSFSVFADVPVQTESGIAQMNYSNSASSPYVELGPGDALGTGHGVMNNLLPIDDIITPAGAVPFYDASLTFQLWMYIIGSTSQIAGQKLDIDLVRHCLTTVTSGIDLQAAMGCSNETMLGIATTSHLAYQIAHTNVTIKEASLTAGYVISTYFPSTIPTVSAALEHSLQFNDQDALLMPNPFSSSSVDYVYQAAGRVYLESVLQYDDPDSIRIKVAVEHAIQALRYSSLVPAVFPMTVAAACARSVVDRAFFMELFNRFHGDAVFGNLDSAIELVNLSWNGTHSSFAPGARIPCWLRFADPTRPAFLL